MLSVSRFLTPAISKPFVIVSYFLITASLSVFHLFSYFPASFLCIPLSVHFSLVLVLSPCIFLISLFPSILLFSQVFLPSHVNLPSFHACFCSLLVSTLLHFIFPVLPPSLLLPRFIFSHFSYLLLNFLHFIFLSVPPCFVSFSICHSFFHPCFLQFFFLFFLQLLLSPIPLFPSIPQLNSAHLYSLLLFYQTVKSPKYSHPAPHLPPHLTLLLASFAPLLSSRCVFPQSSPSDSYFFCFRYFTIHILPFPSSLNITLSSSFQSLCFMSMFYHGLSLSSTLYYMVQRCGY